MMIIWKKSVSATDHIPPYSVYRRTIAAPIIMPISGVIEPCDRMLNTRPSALICAATQPR